MKKVKIYICDFYDLICKFKYLKIYRIKINGYNVFIFKIYSICVFKFYDRIILFFNNIFYINISNYRNKISGDI